MSPAARRTLFSVISSLLGRSQPSTRLSASGASGVLARQYTLPTVEIWGTPDNFVFDDFSLWERFGDRYWDGDFYINDYVDCKYFSDEHWAIQDELNEFIADSTAFGQATEAVALYTCVPQSSGPGKICVDLFIHAKSAGPLTGDNRNLDANAPYSKSRLQAYLDPETNQFRVSISNSSTVTNFIFVPTTVQPDPNSTFSLYSTSDTTRIFELRAYNGYCVYFPQWGDFPCPAIDAMFKFTKVNGFWTIAQSSDVQRDAFPTAAVYRYENGGFTPVYSSPETQVTELLTRKKTLEDWRAKLNAALPPGCYLE